VSNDDPFSSPILVGDTRILRPCEYKQFKNDGIPKNDYRIMFDAVLCTGMRYSEFLELQKNPKWFNATENRIYLPKIAVRKKKIKRKQRWIKLSDSGSQMVASFFNIKQKLPNRRTWYENLLRWAEISDIGVEGITIKMTRKTYECWLIEYYGSIKGEDNITPILLSQGHTRETAINHYLSLPFTRKDHDEMGFMMEGWK